MPLTRLANSIIDGVSERSAPVAEEVARYLASDLICYRAGSPRGLVERGAAIPGDPWRLGALHSVTTLTGLGAAWLALARGRITADEAWAAAHVDEDWNMEQWGRDELALERRAYRYAELQAAATVLKNT